MSYSLNFEKMQEEIQSVECSKYGTSKKGDYVVVGAKQNTINNCKYYEPSEFSHYSSNDFYKITSHLKKDKMSGFIQKVEKIDYNNTKIDKVTNYYQVENVKTHQIEDKSYTIYIQDLEAFKNEWKERQMLQLYIKKCDDAQAGYIIRWDANDEFTTKNGNRYKIKEGRPQRIREVERPATIKASKEV